MNETNNTLKTVLSTACLIITLGVLTVNFQNCSGLSAADYGSSNEAVSQAEDGLLTVVNDIERTTNVETSELTAVFAAGESFNDQTLVSSGSFLDSLIKTLNYKSKVSGKAIAMAQNGLGYVAITGKTDLEAERMAVESCNYLTGRSCALIVSGNYFVAASDKVFEGSTYLLKDLTGSTFNKDEIPMVRSLARNSAVVSNYIKTSRNKALAISVTGGLYSVFSTIDSLTVNEVKRMAIQRCELEAEITPCALYAVNTDVVFNPETFEKKSYLDFSTNNVSELPPPAAKDGALTKIKSFLKDTGRKKYAMYITPSGEGFLGSHETDVEKAKAETLDRCESGFHGTRCIAYATSKGMSFSPDSMKSKSKYGGIFCKALRYSCSEHLSLGCSQGEQYWVQNPGTYKSELTVCGN